MILSEPRKQHIKGLIELCCRNCKDIDADNLYDYITNSIAVCIPDSYTSEFYDDYLENLVYLWILMDIGQLGSLSILISDEYPNLMVSNLLRAICNSVYSVLHLATHGLDYSAKIILRILMEQYMILLSTTSDVDKRKDYISAWESSDATKAWYRHFSKKRFVEFIDKYFSNTTVDRNDLINWIEQKYSHYSGYVHNDYPYVYLWSYVELEKDCLKPNLCGEYITRTSDLLYDCFYIAFTFGLMFLKMLEDPNVDLSINGILNHDALNVKTTKDMYKFKLWLGLQIIRFKTEESHDQL